MQFQIGLDALRDILYLPYTPISACAKKERIYILRIILFGKE
jgi:hypothetical protein